MADVLRFTRRPDELVGRIVDCPHCYRQVAIVELEDERVVLARHDNRNSSGFCKASVMRADDESVGCDEGQHEQCLGWVHGSHPPKYGICTCVCHEAPA